MRILHVVHQYVPDHVAGTELYTQSVARGQVRRGHDVAVFTPLNRGGHSPVEADMEEGVRVYRAPAGARGGTAVFRSTFSHASLMAAFTTVLGSERPDIIHLQHMMGVPAAVGAIIRDSSIPYIISLHDYWYGCANGQLLTNDTSAICGGPDQRFHNCGRCAVARAGWPGGARLLGWAAAPVLRRRDELVRPIFENAACILAPNEFVRRIHADMGFPIHRVIINPLGLDIPPQVADQVTARRDARGTGGLRLVYIGSISPQKGLHVLIEAMNGLPEDAVMLDIFGDLAVFPEYGAELQASSHHPGVRFRGQLAREALFRELAQFDALVMPTLWYEASPATIREAFAAGLPVIASDLGAPGSMIRHEVDGLLFPPGDASALLTIIRELIDRPERIDRLRRGIDPLLTESDHLDGIDEAYRVALGSVATTFPERR